MREYKKDNSNLAILIFGLLKPYVKKAAKGRPSTKKTGGWMIF
jgi:hypothetical protein